MAATAYVESPPLRFGVKLTAICLIELATAVAGSSSTLEDDSKSCSSTPGESKESGGTRNPADEPPPIPIYEKNANESGKAPISITFTLHPYSLILKTPSAFRQIFGSSALNRDDPYP